MHFMPESRTAALVLDLCLRIGEVLLASGAGAADVKVTLQSVAWKFGVRYAEIDVTFTSLTMSYQPEPEKPALVSIRQVNQRVIDYADLTQVDHLVRYIMTGQVDLTEARLRLRRIVSSGHSTPRWAITLGWGAMCAGAVLQVGGGLVVAGLAALAGMIIDRTQLDLARRRLPYFYRQITGGMIATGIALAAGSVVPSIDPSAMITANIIMLLAGVGFLGALYDAMSGFYITAGARLLEAIMATSGIIGGVSAGLSLAAMAGWPLHDIEVGRFGWQAATFAAGGAAIAASAFAFASYAPRRILLPIAVIGGMSALVFQTVMAQGFGRPWAAGVAAFCVGLVSYSVSGIAGVPPLVVVVPGVIPLLPGLLIFRGLTLLSEAGSDPVRGLLALITAGTVAMALAAGVILGEYVAQPLKREARRLPTRLAGPRLVGAWRAPLRWRQRLGRGTTVPDDPAS